MLGFADPMSDAADHSLPFTWGDELPRLVAERVVLRHLRRDDVPRLYEIFSDRKVTRYWGTPPLANLAAAEDLRREIDDLFHRRSLFQWAVARRDDDRLLGTATLWHVVPAHRRAEIGFALGRRVWGRGYMGEALTTLIGFAFDSLGLFRLEADVDPRNAPSLRLLERLGFHREGLLRQRYHAPGEIQDSVILGLLAPEWRTPSGA